MPEAVTPLVEVKNCTMEFPGVKALSDVDFTLMPGECHVLVGENGAGKSTLSKCITGENRMTKGELYIKGENRPRKLWHPGVAAPRHSDRSSGIHPDGGHDGCGKSVYRPV